jgi:hypothetical protein
LISMTASGGDSGEKPQNEGPQTPSDGTYEAPPIEQSQGSSGYDAPITGPDAPASTGYEPPSGYPPPGYASSSYPPPPPGYATQQPGYQPPTPPQGGYPPQYGGPYPSSAPPPPQFGGQPYPGGYNYPNPQAGTNTMAISSLVASVIGLLCGIGSIVGIVLGVVALNQIKQTRQAGYGLAIAGIVVGVATLIISMIWTIYALR